MSRRGPRVRVFPTVQALAEAAARVIRRDATRAVHARGRFTIALSGGETPEQLYRRLAAAGPRALPYGRMDVLWSDERAVPPGRRDSNYRRAHDLWLSQAPMPPERVHRIRGEIDPRRAAATYERVLRRVAVPRRGRHPRIDLILLGVGPDGHTASLFPGSPVPPSRRWVVATEAPVPPRQRVTMTLRTIRHARRVLVLVSGSLKAGAVRQALEDSASDALPASRLRWPAVTWLLDRRAAARLRGAARLHPTAQPPPPRGRRSRLTAAD